MRTDRRLYLVSSQPGAPVKSLHAGAAHLRLVARAPEVPTLALTRTPEPPASAARPIAPPLTSRPIVRPFGQRVLQAASDVAVFAVALLVGLRPNA